MVNMSLRGLDLGRIVARILTFLPQHLQLVLHSLSFRLLEQVLIHHEYHLPPALQLLDSANGYVVQVRCLSLSLPAP